MGSPETEEGRLESEGPRHKVTVPDFYMGRYPVTNEEYGRFLEANPGKEEPRFWGDRRFSQSGQPVIGINWHEAKAYAGWAGWGLPSEAQWEYACRAGTTTRYYTGDSEADLERAGWYAENSGDRPHTVGEKEPNAFGLFDMHGNVWEWCEDMWHDNYEKAPNDGKVWVDGSQGSARVRRGGSWGLSAWFCRSAYRDWLVPGGRDRHFGFRLVFLPGRKQRGKVR